MFSVRKIFYWLVALFVFTGMCACFAPIEYSANGNLVKVAGSEQLTVDRKTEKYIQKQKISKCELLINHKFFYAHIKYATELEEKTVYDCWLDNDDQLDFGVYYYTTQLGKIQMWMILLNYF